MFQPASWTPLASDDCPSSCSNVFGRLDEGSNIGERRVQAIHVQERGGALLLVEVLAVFTRTHARL